MHPFVLSRATNPRPSVHLLPPTPPSPPPRPTPPCSGLYMLSRGAAALFFTPEKGELGGVGDVRLLHYVFLTEPPLTSTLSPSTSRPSSLRHSFFSLSPSPSLPSSPLAAFSLELRPLPFRVLYTAERILPAEVFFFRARADVPFNHPTRRCGLRETVPPWN